MKIGILGLGTMGKDITELCFSSGHQVILYDKDPKILGYTKNYVLRNCKLKNLKIEDRDENILCARGLEDFRDSDIIIESISENIREKQEIHRQLLPNLSKGAIVFVNTSSIPIHTITQAFDDKKNSYIGVHFMNPVNQINTFEIIDSEKIFLDSNKKKTKEKIVEFFLSINKQFIFSPDIPGFISNRISHLMMNEASSIMAENNLRAEEVDQVFVKCFGHKMGPLATADLIGVDVVRNTLNVIYELTKEEKYIPSAVINRLVDDNKLGIKEGRGFYEYF